MKTEKSVFTFHVQDFESKIWKQVKLEMILGIVEIANQIVLFATAMVLICHKTVQCDQYLVWIKKRMFLHFTLRI